MKNISNHLFGRLLALKPVGRNRQGCIVWECLCDCGSLVKVSGAELRKKLGTKSCGCLNVEKSREKNTSHGLSYDRIYTIRKQIIARCSIQENPSYKQYGGRGITICDEWRASVMQFFSYVSKLPHYGEHGYTLDRIDNDGNYEPGNVRWATIVQQSRNKRTNRMLTWNGKTQCIAAWSDELNILEITIGARLRRGWDVKRTLETPVRKGI